MDPLQNIFEHLSNFRYSSNATPIYNCIAWAASVDNQFWWPTPIHKTIHWPAGVSREENTNAFEEAFRTLGYEHCGNGELETGFEKVAIYAKADVVTHMARQLPNGWWTSKLGAAPDIEHLSPGELEGNCYGAVELYMRRPLF